MARGRESSQRGSAERPQGGSFGVRPIRADEGSRFRAAARFGGSGLSRYVPPLAVMTLIFALSATPDLNSGLGAWDTLLRKLAHIAIFGVLWLTLARAAYWRRPLLATAIAILYAISDELHQSFVEGRHGTPLDVAIDAFGIGLAVLAWIVVTRRRGAVTSGPVASAG